MDLSKEEIGKEINELKEMLESNEELLSMTKDVMEDFDKEQTGFLSIDDFLACILEFNEGPFAIKGFLADQINDLFNKFDLDKDRKLSEQEVKLFIIDRLKSTIQTLEKMVPNQPDD